MSNYDGEFLESLDEINYAENEYDELLFANTTRDVRSDGQSEQSARESAVENDIEEPEGSSFDCAQVPSPTSVLMVPSSPLTVVLSCSLLCAPQRFVNLWYHWTDQDDQSIGSFLGKAIRLQPNKWSSHRHRRIPEGVHMLSAFMNVNNSVTGSVPRTLLQEFETMDPGLLLLIASSPKRNSNSRHKIIIHSNFVSIMESPMDSSAQCAERIEYGQPAQINNDDDFATNSGKSDDDSDTACSTDNSDSEGESLPEADDPEWKAQSRKSRPKEKRKLPRLKVMAAKTADGHDDCHQDHDEDVYAGGPKDEIGMAVVKSMAQVERVFRNLHDFSPAHFTERERRSHRYNDGDQDDDQDDDRVGMAGTLKASSFYSVFRAMLVKAGPRDEAGDMFFDIGSGTSHACALVVAIEEASRKFRSPRIKAVACG